MCHPLSAYVVVSLKRPALLVHPRPPRDLSETPANGLLRAAGIKILTVLAALSLALICADRALAVENHFDADAEGWTVTDAKTGVGSGPATWLAPGVINTNDQFDWNAFAAPAAYLGDQSVMFGGTLSFDLQAARQDPNAASYFTAAFRSAAELLVWFGGAPSLTELTHISVTLAPGAGWELNPSGLGAPGTGGAVDVATFRAFLQQVDGLYIDADYRFGSDNVTLDNVLMLPVPEPGALSLWLAGGLVVGWLTKARRPGSRR